MGKIINRLGLVLLTGLFCFSCISEKEPTPNNGGGSDTDETGLLSLDLYIATELGTKAATDPGSAGENNVDNMRVILYAADYSGVYKAVKILDYDLTVSDLGLLSNNPPVIQTKAVEVKRQNYKLAVLVNYFNPNINATTNILAAATAAEGHPISAVIDPIDYYALNSSDPDKWKGSAFNFLTGYDDSTPVTMGNDADSQGLFFMSNGDDLTDVTPEMIYTTESLAESNPVQVNLDRGVAKVAVIEGDQLESQLAQAGAVISDFSWRVDIMNKVMYPLRKPTFTAPYGDGKGPMESYSTDRYDRYAVDPNFDGFSRDRNSSAPGSPLAFNFERIFDGADPATGKQYFGHLTMAASEASIGADNVEYTLENTMESEEQYEDVTTRVLFRGNYRPLYTELGTIQQAPAFRPNAAIEANAVTRAAGNKFPAGVSYFWYGNYAFTAEQMRIMYDAHSRIPDDPSLEGLYNLFSDQMANPAYGPGNTGYQFQYDPQNPYYDPSQPEGTMISTPDGPVANYQWNQQFFDEYGHTSGGGTYVFVSVYDTDLEDKEVPHEILVSIPNYGFSIGTVNYNFWNYSYDPSDPDFIPAFSLEVPNIYRKEFPNQFPWVFGSGTPVAKSWMGLNFYLDGISYYGVPIRHFDNVQSPVPAPGQFGYGRYGVVRNNYYKLTVNSITGPGSPTIPDPDGPDDGEGWISVYIQVMPWLVRYQYIPLQ